MKGIGILRGTSIRIPNHRVPNYPIYHELMAACLKRWCYFSFQDAFQFRARESKAAAGEDLMELEWSGDTDLYLKIHVFLLSSYFKMGKAIGFISPGNESISYPIHKYGKGRWFSFSRLVGYIHYDVSQIYLDVSLPGDFRWRELTFCYFLALSKPGKSVCQGRTLWHSEEVGILNKKKKQPRHLISSSLWVWQVFSRMRSEGFPFIVGVWGWTCVRFVLLPRRRLVVASSSCRRRLVVANSSPTR